MRVRAPSRLLAGSFDCQGGIVISGAQKVLQLIGGNQADENLQRQIEKFIRCNGQLGVIKAANAVARRRKDEPTVVRDPWAYCIQVFNASAARSIMLHQMMYLLENSLRSRVDVLMTASQGRDWYRDLDSYLPREIAPVFQTDPQFEGVQDRGGTAVPPFAIKEFRQGVTFAERIPFWGLTAVITHNYAKGPLYELFIPPAGGQRLDPEFVSSALDKLRAARNEVAHHRPISPQLYEQSRIRAHRFLDHLEFDVDRASDRIGAAVRDLGARLTS